MSRSKKGFTIVELVIVIAVVAILAAVLIPTFSSLIKKANDSAYLQERTNQQIADLAEKVENQKFLSWEDLEAKLAEELAKIDIPESATPAEMKAAVEKAAEDAIAEYLSANQGNNTALTEDQVKAIVEKALEGQLTTAQVEAIVDKAVESLKNNDNSYLTAEQIKEIIDEAVANLDKQTGITAEEMEAAITAAINAQPNLKPTDVQTIVNNALSGFGYGNDPSIGDIKDIIDSAIEATKEKLSADELAVDAMNEKLAAASPKPTTILELFDTLAAAGIDAENYEPLTSNNYFFWDNKANCIVYTDKNGNVLHTIPGYTKASDANWLSLSQTIATSKPEGYAPGAATVNVATAEELMYVVEDLRDSKVNNGGVTINLTADVDMLGGNMSIWTGTNNQGKLAVMKPIILNGNGHTLKNLSNVDTGAWLGDMSSDSHNGIYGGSALFTQIQADVTISNLTLDNAHVKNTHLTNVALLASNTSGGDLFINNVTISNSSVIAWRNVGALVGLTGTTGKVTATSVKLNNVHVGTVGGRSGMLIGNYNIALDITDTIGMSNCSFYVYECEQNKPGVQYTDSHGVSGTLGYTETSVNSWAYEADGNTELKTGQVFNKNMLCAYAAGVDASKVTGWNN